MVEWKEEKSNEKEKVLFLFVWLKGKSADKKKNLREKGQRVTPFYFPPVWKEKGRFNSIYINNQYDKINNVSVNNNFFTTFCLLFTVFYLYLLQFFIIFDNFLVVFF